MGRRLVGSVMFLGVALALFEIGGGLAMEKKANWGWFLISGLILSGVALNLWTEASPPSGCPRCRKPDSRHDL